MIKRKKVTNAQNKYGKSNKEKREE